MSESKSKKSGAQEVLSSEKTEAIEKIRKNMEKDQYYLLCQYAIGIVEAKG